MANANGLTPHDLEVPDLTLVVPVWDRYVDLLPELCASLEEELPGAPVIVIDNASSIPLPPAIAARIIRLTQRRSTGAARNAALPFVRTEFVCFFDADDRPVPGALRELVATARQRVEAVAVAGTGVAWHPATSAKVDIPFSDRVLRLQRHPLWFGLAGVVRNRYPTVGSILRSSAVVDAGGFSDLCYCEDWGLSASLAFRGPIFLVQRPVFFARIHPGSMIHCEGTSRGIVRSLVPLYRRWLLDGAIPLWVKPLFILTPIPRLKQAYDRWRTDGRSHDDLFAVLGRHGLLDDQPSGDAAKRRVT